MRQSAEDIARLREAFDRNAGTYDGVFSKNPLAREMRARTWQLMDSLFAPGSSILDLGCGTGEDALHMARRGVSVRAVDLSAGMVDQVRRKAAAAGVGERVRCEVGDYSKIRGCPGEYDGMYSNFGALNCVADMGWLGDLARRVLKPGAPLVLVLMSRFYPLEFAANILKGRFRTSTARWRPAPGARIGGIEVRVHYHRLGVVRRALAPHCTLEHSEALCLFMPVPGLDHLNARFADGFRLFRPLDLWLGRRWPMSGLGDHFMSVWRLGSEGHDEETRLTL